MGNKYNFRIDQPEPSSGQIRSYQDFGALLKEHQQVQPKRRFPLRVAYIASTAAAAAIALLVYFQINTANELSPVRLQEMAQTHFAEQPYINPPLPEAAPRFASYTVNGTDGGAVALENGARLRIPAMAFQNNRGQAVTGPVDIRYRELYDQVDFLLAGIPMSYDSAGNRYQMESAGLIEVMGFVNGKPVNMAPGKVIEVELVSIIDWNGKDTPPSFNVYQLDSSIRNWVYQQPARQELEVLTANTQDPALSIQQAYEQEIKAINESEARLRTEAGSNEFDVQQPTPPQAYREGVPTFDIDSEEAEDKTIWQLAPDETRFDERMANVIWESAQVEKTGERTYQLVLQAEGIVRRLNVLPVLQGDDYQRALSQYQQELAVYEQARQEYETQIEAQLTDELSAFKAARAEADSRRQAALETLEAQAAPTQQLQLTHRFEIDAFGTWNCERPLPNARQQHIVQLSDQHGNDYEQQTVYLIDKNRNTVYQFYGDQYTLLQFEQGLQPYLFVLTEDNRMAVLRSSAPLQKSVQGRSVQLQLELVEEAIQKEEDVRAVLEM